MRFLPVSLAVLLLAAPAPPHAAQPAGTVPAFAGPTPDTLRTISIPTVDISGDTARHVVVARGTDTAYQGHCDTVLLADGRTMFVAWCMNHAGHLGPLARSDDGGRTWTPPLDVPPDWPVVKRTTPVLHRLTDPQGVERLFLFGGCDFPGNIRRAYSEDGGRTWSPMAELGLVGEVAPKSILPFDDGRRLVMWSDRRDPANAQDPQPVVWQSESLDGGLTWSRERVVLVVPGQWAQPCVTRSADGGRLVMLMRENTRRHNSLYSVSTDDARTWSESKELPAALTGDRHVIKRAPDGRLVVAFRDMSKASPTYGHYVAWVGTFEDIENRREGQYRIKLLHNSNRTPADAPGAGNTDCGYSDLELLPDGTFVATTYVKYAPGPEQHSIVSTRFTLGETDALARPRDTSAHRPGLVPAGWDPALAGDEVLRRLVRVTAPHVKGAHDAEFVCVGDRAYVVEHDNDVAPGHGAGKAMYCVLTVVNLGTLAVEKTHLLARAGQAFANATLPDAQIFVPRIIRKDEHTLRTFFCSQPTGEQAVTWYRDFDLRSQTFEDRIHKAKLRTAAGTFDMEPRHFHADAVAAGFTKPAIDHGLYVFDSFKEFDGRTYVALNNFPGKQNALAVLDDDLTTFEVVGHYNEPQSQQLSESAVNRLPDGTWMAICRNDAGNYHFTTSRDGRAWTVGEPRPFVPNGLNSKPTFDRFGGTYYLGWQENTRVGDCNRSVFNVDVSRDGTTWARKYRFETPHSFQYPTFHEHEGVIWLTVTQSDHGGSSDRIMFGRLEAVGGFEPPARAPDPLAPAVIVDPGAEFQDAARPGAMIIGIDRTPRGRLWGCWTGTGDKKDGYFLLATSDDGGATWSRPRLAVGARTEAAQRVHGALVGNLWTDPQGRLWLFFDQQLGDPQGRITNWWMRCDDPDAAAPTWTEPVMFAEGCTLNKPTVLANGDWLVPVSDWQKRTARVFASSDSGATLKERGSLRFPDWEFDEHMMVELRDGRLWMLARTKGQPFESFSTDGGASWSEPRRAATVQNVNARFFLRRLRSGRILLVKNGSPAERLPQRSHMTAWLSEDEGLSWQGGLLLDERTAVSYPDGFEAPDGLIHVLYDWNRHTDAEILLATFREADVLAGQPVSPDTRLRRLVNKAAGPKPEKLFNGIELPDIWPPRFRDPASVEPMDVPYLRRPPRVIPIDVGRQLFVDDFLIQETTLTRTFHRPEKFAGNPVLRAETPRELAGAVEGRTAQKATVYTGHGGLFFDPHDSVFRLFYTAGWRGPLAVATSPDLVHWTRPDLGLAGDNCLLPEGRRWTGPALESSGSDDCVWLDLAASSPAERIKFLTCWMHVPARERPRGFTHTLHVSDGRTWSEGRPTGMAEDYCSFFFNPFRGVWAFSIKQGGPRGRCRYYAENKDFLAGADWSRAVYWTNADRLDPPEPVGGYPGAGEPTQLYSLNAVAYESLMLGMHMIHRGPRNEICDQGGFPKLSDLHLGFSRDGFHWDRPDRRPFIAAARTEGAWDRAYVHPTTGVLVVLDDRLVFPYCAFSGIAPDGQRGMYTGGSVGLAMLRRDGFASMDGPGVLTTRPLEFAGRHLFVNVRGRLRVEVLDGAGAVLAESEEVAGDDTRTRVTWAGPGDRRDLADLAGRPVRLRFALPEGSLYAFWVTPDAGGASRGYLGAGGPAHGGVRDVAPTAGAAPDPHLTP